MANQNDTKLIQSNALTSSRYDFSKIEKNVIYHIIKKIQGDYVEGTVQDGLFENVYVTIPASELSKIVDKDHTAYVKKALRALRHKDIEMEDAEGNWIHCGFINVAKYYAKNNRYEVEVSKELIPHLLELARNYTAYSLAIAMSLKSVYSQRFYELCCQYRNRIEKDGYAGFHKTQKQLRQMFCLENKYPLNADFNRRVINTAMEELKHAFDAGQCDLYFDVNIRGRGKEVCYDFKIRTKEFSEKQKIIFEDARAKWLHIHRNLTHIFKNDPKFVDRTMREIDFNPSLIGPVFEKLEKVKNGLTGDGRAKLLRFILKEDFDLK